MNKLYIETGEEMHIDDHMANGVYTQGGSYERKLDEDKTNCLGSIQPFMYQGINVLVCFNISMYYSLTKSDGPLFIYLNF